MSTNTEPFWHTVPPEEWQPENIGRIWEYFSARKDLRANYFAVGQGFHLLTFLRLSEALTTGGLALDYGCGPGGLLDRFVEQGIACMGLDSSEESIRLVNDRYAGQAAWRGAVVSPRPPAPFDNETFDLATCIETVEHLPDEVLPSVLGDIFRLLKPGGFALVTTPNEEDLIKEHTYCPFYNNCYHNYQHMRSLDSNFLKQCLDAQGFAVPFCKGLYLERLNCWLPSWKYVTPAALVERISKGRSLEARQDLPAFFPRGQAI